MENKRDRSNSSHFMTESDLTVEDLTVIKLMEEIMEFD
jgi:hypothetical protein